eukprot:1134501-Prorocentrum_lima.AAC.1
MVGPEQGGNVARHGVMPSMRPIIRQDQPEVVSGPRQGGHHQSQAAASNQPPDSGEAMHDEHGLDGN